MAKGPDHTDNVTKMDKPVLRLKMTAKRSATPSSKTRYDHKKPRQDNPDQANQTGAQPRGKSGASANKNRKYGNVKNAATKTVATTTLKSRSIVFDILSAVEDDIQLDKAIAAHNGMTRLDGRDRRFVQLLATTCLRRRGQIGVLVMAAALSGNRKYHFGHWCCTIIIFENWRACCCQQHR